MKSPLPSEIIKCRTDAGLTQTQAAEMVHSGLRTWQQWEKGDRNMPPGLWELFSLKINLSSLKLEELPETVIPSLKHPHEPIESIKLNDEECKTWGKSLRDHIKTMQRCSGDGHMK